MNFEESFLNNHQEEIKELGSFASLVDKIKKQEDDGDLGIVEENFKIEELAEELKKHIELIEKSKVGNYFNLTEPEGVGGSFEEEIEKYEAAKNLKDDYKVSLSYPHINMLEDGFWDELKIKEQELLSLKDGIEMIDNKSVKDVLLEVLAVEEAKVKHLFLLKEWNATDDSLTDRRLKIEDECFECLSKIYGDIDDDLADKAFDYYKNINSGLGIDQEKTELEEVLIANRFDAQEIVWEFNSFFEKAGMSNCVAVIDEAKKNCSTSIKSNKYGGKTVVIIPANHNINGLKLLQLIHHESWHAITGEHQSGDLGLGSIKFGKNADSVKEGLAVLNEMDVTNRIFGYDKLRHKAHPYYIMAMKEIDRISNGASESVNPGEIYSFLLGVIRKDFEERGYGEDEIRKEAKKITRRVFRGAPGGRHYNPKDSMYFKGEEIAQALKESGLLKYVEQLYIDPELIPLFMEIGIYKDSDLVDKTINGFREVMGDIIRQENWQEKFLEDRNLWRFFSSWEK